MANESTESVDNAPPRLSMFKGLPGAIKTLRRSYKNRLQMLDMDKLHAELSGESDRASIILMASLLDDVLAYRIARNFCFNPTEDEYDDIFKPDGPLGSFSARMNIASMFGFIEDATWAQLNTIREMRNACAH